MTSIGESIPMQSVQLQKANISFGTVGGNPFSVWTVVMVTILMMPMMLPQLVLTTPQVALTALVCLVEISISQTGTAIFFVGKNTSKSVV